MAHQSGNPTWKDYPNTTTPVTAPTLENIENAIDKVTGPPTVDAYKTADTTGLAAGDYFVASGFVLRGSDPYGMWSQPQWSGVAPYTVTIPSGWGGRYDIEWFWLSSGSSGFTTGKVLRNCPSSQTNPAAAAVNYSFLSATGSPASAGEGTPCRIRSSRLLNANDTLNFHIYSSVTFDYRATVFNGVTTEIVVRYLGPT